MIDPACFSREWLETCREQVGRMDPVLLEKSMYAFDLLGRLQKAGLPFVFKGGTAMLLLLDQFRRLSIDVDIVCSLPEEDVFRVIREVAAKGPYLSMDKDARDPDRLPKRHHYLFQYQSVLGGTVPQFLQLDVLQDKAHYPELQQKPLLSRFIKSTEDISIVTPTIEGLLGDKLTAFAPRTVGVHYGAYKAPIRIAKQISDIGELFTRATKGPAVLRAYNALFEAENSYRKKAFSRDQTLDDTIEAAKLLGSVLLKGHKETEESRILLSGVGLVDTHMIGQKYTLDDAKLASARAAHLAAMLKCGSMPEDLNTERFDAAMLPELINSELQESWRPLHRLKQANEQTYYHWSRVQYYLE